MGKKRVAFIDEKGEITTKKKKKEERQKVRVAGLKGGEKVVDMGITENTEKVAPILLVPSVTKKPIRKAPRIRGKNYQAARTKVDPTKLYSIQEAVNLVKQASICRFDGSVDAHISTHKKGLTGEVKLPYFKGKAKKVVVADDKVLKKIKAGKIDFDVLLATKEFMPKLVPYAKALGPKGLMPNPKAGTIVDDPKTAIKSFQTSSIHFKTEKEQPLIHIKIGQVSQPEKELVENLQALISAIGRSNIKKLTIAPTMGPGVRVEVSGI